MDGLSTSGNISGLFAVVDSARWEEVLSSLGALSGVEVHQQDRATGRLVLTQETESIDAQVEGLGRIRNVPGVQKAELVYHYQEEPETSGDEIAG